MKNIEDAPSPDSLLHINDLKMIIITTAFISCPFFYLFPSYLSPPFCPSLPFYLSPSYWQQLHPYWPLPSPPFPSWPWPPPLFSFSTPSVFASNPGSSPC